MKKIRCEPTAWTYQAWIPEDSDNDCYAEVKVDSEFHISATLGNGSPIRMEVEKAEALRWALNAWAKNRDRKNPEMNPDE